MGRAGSGRAVLFETLIREFSLTKYPTDVFPSVSAGAGSMITRTPGLRPEAWLRLREPHDHPDDYHCIASATLP